jgi:hypothetical protein
VLLCWESSIVVIILRSNYLKFLFALCLHRKPRNSPFSAVGPLDELHQNTPLTKICKIFHQTKALSQNRSLSILTAPVPFPLRLCPAGFLACGNGFEFACYDPFAVPSYAYVQNNLVLGDKSDGSEITICQDPGTLSKSSVPKS